MMVSETEKRCPSCKEVKKATSENWYFRPNGSPVSTCIPCRKRARWEQRLRLKQSRKVIPAIKRCPKCDVVKTADDFPRSESTHDGLHSWCRDCNSEYYSLYYRGWRKDTGRRTVNRYRINRYSTRGYVYLFKLHDYYKIGVTVNPEKRLRALNTQHPYDAELMACCMFDDMYVIERELHERFEKKRIDGKEWFRLTYEDVEYVKRMLCTEQPVDDPMVTE